MKIDVIGRGRVGRSLARALRRSGHSTRVVAARSLLATSRRPKIDAPLVVLAVRDDALPTIVAVLGRIWAVGPRRSRTVLHTSGRIGPEALGPLRARGASVAQAYPLVSFASTATPVDATTLLVRGDQRAVERARALARGIGMKVLSGQRIDPTLFHAGAALVANGAAALGAAGARLLASAGAPRRESERALAGLLRSVARNVPSVGLPAALTGPVRRGDAVAIARHLGAIRRAAPDLGALYRAIALAQVPLSESLAEATPGDLREIRRLLTKRP